MVEGEARIDGRRWRATDPSLPEKRRRELVRELMSARSAVGWAKRRKDAAAERARLRSGRDVALAALERAAELSVDRGPRALRLFGAGELAFELGRATDQRLMRGRGDVDHHRDEQPLRFERPAR